MSRPRIAALDLARTAALLGMVAYHFVYDLALFNFLPPRQPFTPFWKGLAVLTAGSFLFLAGVSLHLAHARGLRWPAFRARLLRILAAALLITVVSYLYMPDRFIHFGILHAIATASVIGLAFLRVPVWGVILAAIAAFFAPNVLTSDFFSPDYWHWTGLAPKARPALDFVPLFPWIAPFLAGMAVSKAATNTGLWTALQSRATPSRAMRILAWPGRHTLIIYLLHQPLLVGLVAGAAALV
ncbi:heparan-alpha-glucosaminide N-acetyltransferase [Celeribacter arenosi]|uniref:Heparan-alpha-glucosaminide N-acetyltransferase catalytic domain-containing protein n=1 Tax=Celeribacter arenosi TaxID=792649 RepID=A0ABP7K3E4_9RHOB